MRFRVFKNALIAGLAASSASYCAATEIYTASFTEPDGAALVGYAPETSNGVSGATFRAPTSAWPTDVQGNRARLGADIHTSIAVASSGAYTQPEVLRLSATLDIGTIAGSTTASNTGLQRGVVLGYYTGLGNYASGENFRGLLIGTDGRLIVAQTGASGSSRFGFIEEVATGLDFSNPVTLSYHINTTTGDISNILLDGILQPDVTTTFFDADVNRAGVGASSDTGGTFAFFDDFTVTGQTTIDIADLTYTISNGEVTITDCATAVSGDLIVPDTIEGFPVVSLGSRAFQCCKNITRLTIPEGVRSVGSYCFFNVDRATEIILPSTLTSFGLQAFRSCNQLASIAIPEGTTSLPPSLLIGCTSLTNVTLPSSLTSIGDFTFWVCTSLERITIPGSVRHVPKRCFLDCSSLKFVTLEEGVESIAGDAFEGCTSLETLHLPASLTDISTALQPLENFQGATVAAGNSIYAVSDGILYNLDQTQLVDLPRTRATAFVIPDTVTSITSGAMQNCSLLPELTIGLGLNSLARSELDGCSSLNSVLVAIGHSSLASNGDALTTLGGETLLLLRPTYSGLYTVPSSITTIADSAANDCDGLTEVVLPSGIVSVGDSAFRHCDSLASVDLQGASTTLGTSVFSNCSLLNSVSLPDGLLSLPNDIFSSCVSLTSLSLPSSVSSIGANAFRNCSALSSINLTAVQSIGDNAFRDSGLTTAALSSATLIGNSAFRDCKSLAQVTFSGSDVSLGNHCFDSCDQISQLDLSGISVIPEHAFDDCSLLNEVTFSDALVSIGEEGFAYTSITDLEFPEGLQRIGAYAFGECNLLRHLELPASLTTLEGESFYECPELVSVLFRGNAPTLDDSDNFGDGNANLLLYYYTGAFGFGATFDSISTQAIDASAYPEADWSLAQGLSYDQSLGDTHIASGASYRLLYALDLDVATTTSSHLPRIIESSGEMQLSFTPARDQLTYQVEYSADLNEWFSTEVILSTGNGETIARIPINGDQRFVRLNIFQSEVIRQ